MKVRDGRAFVQKHMTRTRDGNRVWFDDPHAKTAFVIVTRAVHAMRKACVPVDTALKLVCR
jgi:hypothetical protein